MLVEQRSKGDPRSVGAGAVGLATLGVNSYAALLAMGVECYGLIALSVEAHGVIAGGVAADGWWVLFSVK